MRKFAAFMALPVAMLLLASVGYAQDSSEGPADLNALRRLRLLEVEERPVAASANATVSAASVPQINTWTLDPRIAKNAKGTFGIDLSHYETNKCTIKWPTVIAMGLRYVYLEVNSRREFLLDRRTKLE